MPNDLPQREPTPWQKLGILLRLKWTGWKLRLLRLLRMLLAWILK
jgi:hypothetical protein